MKPCVVRDPERRAMVWLTSRFTDFELDSNELLVR